jgi:hypothetical protein
MQVSGLVVLTFGQAEVMVFFQQGTAISKKNPAFLRIYQNIKGGFP